MSLTYWHLVLNLKRRIAADLVAFFGEVVIRRLLDGVRSGWESDLRTVGDRHLSVVTNAVDSSRIQPLG
jgi:hypothetical protein